MKQKTPKALINKLNRRIEELETALSWFCERVERGEIISQCTYEHFKDLLKTSESAGRS